jgi:predicted lipoprotein with Yx(FWY)xxD motif
MASRSTAKLCRGGVAALAISAMTIIAGCGSASSSSSSSATTAASAAASATSSTTTAAPAAGGQQIGTAKGSGGTYLTGANGRALYLWVADTSGKSACSGACAQAWPPVETKGKPTAGAGVTASDLGTISRSDGSQQVTYKGHPLYYFIADKSAGAVKGQGSNSFGAKWWLVSPAGDAITKSGSSSGQSTNGSSGSSTSSSSGGWG